MGVGGGGNGRERANSHQIRSEPGNDGTEGKTILPVSGEVINLDSRECVSIILAPMKQGGLPLQNYHDFGGKLPSLRNPPPEPISKNGSSSFLPHTTRQDTTRHDTARQDTTRQDTRTSNGVQVFQLDFSLFDEFNICPSEVALFLAGT